MGVDVRVSPGQRGGARAAGRPAQRHEDPGHSAVRYVVTVRQQPAGVRQSVERFSLKPAAYLQQLPRWLPPVAIAALFIAGLAVPGWAGAALLLVVAAFVAWLGILSWPALSAPSRLLRLAVPAALVALALWQGLR